MNVERAQQIIESANDILVTYNDIPVWIQNVDENNKTARVYTAANPEEELDIPVNQLEEK